MVRTYKLNAEDFIEDDKVRFIHIQKASVPMYNGSMPLITFTGPISRVGDLTLMIESEEEHTIMIDYLLSYDGIHYSPESCLLEIVVPKYEDQCVMDKDLDYEPLISIGLVKDVTEEDLDEIYIKAITSGLARPGNKVYILPIIKSFNRADIDDFAWLIYKTLGFKVKRGRISLGIGSKAGITLTDEATLSNVHDGVYLLISDRKSYSPEYVLSVYSEDESVYNINLGSLYNGKDVIALWDSWYEKRFNG